MGMLFHMKTWNRNSIDWSTLHFLIELNPEIHNTKDQKIKHCFNVNTKVIRSILEIDCILSRQ